MMQGLESMRFKIDLLRFASIPRLPYDDTMGAIEGTVRVRRLAWESQAQAERCAFLEESQTRM